MKKKSKATGVKLPPKTKVKTKAKKVVKAAPKKKAQPKAVDIGSIKIETINEKTGLATFSYDEKLKNWAIEKLKADNKKPNKKQIDAVITEAVTTALEGAADAKIRVKE